jgi:hypothetical protein
MAATKAPTWKQVFDAAERTIGSRVNEFARSENFAILMGLVARARREMETRSERASRQLLHLANLPAGSDVNRLMGQIGKLEREVRELRNQLDDAEIAPAVRLSSRPAAQAGASTSSRAGTGSRSTAAASKQAGSGKRKVATNGVVRQSNSRARQDSA